MKKLKLNMKDLKVESFETNSIHKLEKGTVNGYVTVTEGIVSCEVLCPTAQVTCRDTCNFTCDDPTCNFTCDDPTCNFTCDDPTCNGVGGCTGAIACIN